MNDPLLSRGPQGVYRQPTESPGIGWDIEVVEAA